MTNVDRNVDLMESRDAKSASPIRHVKRWGTVGVILVLMGIGYASGWYEYISMSSLIMHRAMLGQFVAEHLWVSIAAYCVLYVLLVALSFPGASFLTIAGGFLFGWLLGGSLTAIAATLGASIIFLAARTSLGTSLKERAGPFMARLSQGFRENAFSYLLFLRLTPVFPFWLVNIAPAIFHVPLRTYAIATFIGIIPGTYAYSFIGAGLDSVIAAQELANPGCAAAGTCSVDSSALVTGELIVAFVVLGVVSLLPILLKRLRARARPAPRKDAGV